MSHKTLCGAVQAKFWGYTQCIYVGDTSETHFLNIKKGGYCSEHKHHYKWNRFFIISGTLKVKIFKEHGVDETILHAGQFTDVPPEEYHQFEALEDCQCLEVYWTQPLNTEDIERKTYGGIKTSQK